MTRDGGARPPHPTWTFRSSSQGIECSVSPEDLEVLSPAVREKMLELMNEFVGQEPAGAFADDSGGTDTGSSSPRDLASSRGWRVLEGGRRGRR